MRGSQRTIGSRLLLLAVAVALPFTILLVLEWVSDVDDARRSGDAAAREQATELEVRIRTDDAQVFQRLEELADDPAILGATPAECAAIFSRYRDLSGEHENLALADAEGNVRCSVRPFPPGATYARSDWFRTLQQQPNAGVFGPLRGEVLPGLVMVHARPLSRNGQFAGALVSCRESLYYLRIARAIRVPPGGVVTIVNQRGVVITRSVDHEKWVGRPGIPLKLVSFSSATPITSLDGVLREYAAVRLPNGWLGGVGWPMSAIYGEVRTLLLRRGALLFGSLLLIFFGGRWIARSIQLPITQLATESARFAHAGEGGTLMIRRGAPREVTELTATFNHVLTARVAAETRLQRQNAFLETLHETTLGLMNDNDLHNLLQTIAHQAAILADTEHTYIGLGDDEHTMRILVGLGAMSMYQGWEVEKGDGVIGRVWESGQTMSVSDYQEYAGKVPDRPGIRALVCVPLRARERVFGGLSLVHMERGRQFSDEQVAMLQRFAQLASITIDNARLDAEARQELDQRRKAEAEVRRLNADLEQRIQERTEELASANRDLEALNVELAGTARMKDEFLANMSHELRTPLNAVLGLSEVLDNEIYGPLNEKQRKAIRTVEESGRHLLDLINDILDLSKIEAGKLELRLAEVDIRSALESSMRMVREAAMRKNIAVELVCDLPVSRFQADERRLKQIVVNLLSNAVKFTPERGRVQVTARALPADGLLEILVEDTGIGIPAERMQHLFEPFVQLDSGHARLYGGTGLGLALVRSLTRLHGGSVDVSSVVGEGSRFAVTLPLALQEREAEAEAVDVPPGDAGRRAVIVEDDADAADQMERYLRALGLDDIRRSDAAGAVQTITAAQPCVVLLDILLGTDTGWSILGKLKASPETRSIPVVVVSVVDDPGRGAAMGAAAYLIKPVRFAEFAARLRHVVPHLRATPVRPSSAARTILLADDNESNITVIRDYLESRGYVIDVARDGLEAVEQAEAMRPDAVLMDVQMPLLDGLSAIRRIRAIDSLAHIPIIALTALAMSGDREKCLSAGADEYLSKPVSLKTLGETLQRLMEPAGA
jgi:signal transduction histidine kinase/CheY-like chemotaxis protein